MIAICSIREQPHYRREAFVTGLTRAGYKLVTSGKPSGPEDLLVIWNRYGSFAAAADRWEACGGTVIVLENGYCGKDEHGRQYYAMSVHGHNGSGWFPIGTEDRFARLGVELQPWREGGEYTLVCGQRCIGSPEMASPPNWHTETARKLGRQARIRPHPGNHAPSVPLEDDLESADACVIWSSGCGIKALAMGIKVMFAAPHWICEESAFPLNYLFAEPRPDDLERSYENRLSAFRKMAWGQRSVDEITSGEPFVTIRERIHEATW